MYLEIAGINKKKGELVTAIEYQQRALDFFTQSDESGLSDHLAELLCT